VNKNRLIKNESLKEKIYNELKKMVITSELEPGSRIVINELCEMFGVSSTPVRDALHYLHADGLIETELNNNYVINISSRDVDEIYEMRELLEPFAIEYIFKRNSDKSLLENLRQKMMNCNADEIFKIDIEFHELILEGCTNQRLKKQLRILLNQSYHIAYKHYHKTRVQDESREEIIAILDAMINKNLDLAKSLLLKHFQNSKLTIKKAVP